MLFKFNLIAIYQFSMDRFNFLNMFGMILIILIGIFCFFFFGIIQTEQNSTFHHPIKAVAWIKFVDQV